MFLKANLVEAVTVLATSEKELHAFVMHGDKAGELGSCRDGPVYIRCACEKDTEVCIVPAEYRSYFTPYSRNTSYSRKESYIRDLQSDLNHLEELLQSGTELPDWAVEILTGNRNSISDSLLKLSD